MNKDTGGKETVMGVGMPQSLLFEEFGQRVFEAFGEIPYHVGSSLISKKWRDVDVRLMLDDKRYKEDGYGNPDYPHDNAKWQAMVLAFSALGKEMTGLPIDFQIQQQSDGNKKYKGRRSALYRMREANQ